MRNLILKTAPAAEPVDIDDAKAHLRVTITDDDDLIDALITAARQRVEAFTQKAFITQDWYLYFDWHEHGWGTLRPLMFDWSRRSNNIKLPFPPLQSLTAFEYLSAANTWTAVDSTIYYLDVPGNQIILTGCLPEPFQRHSGFRVTFRTGYGDTAEKVPEGIRLGIKTIILHLYENRSAYDAAAPVAIPMAGESLLMPYKQMDY